MSRGYLRLIGSLSWPIMVGLILQSFLGTVDLYFVSRLGTVQTAALGMSVTVFIVVNVFSALVSTGVLAIGARRIGEGDVEAHGRVAAEGARLALLIGLALLLLLRVVVGPVALWLCGGDPVMAGHVTAYLGTIVLFTPVLFFNSALRSSRHARGDTRTPLLIFGLANLVNMALDPIFIFRLNLGIRGAALATGFSICLAAALLIRVSDRDAGQGILKRIVTTDWRNSKTILRIGGWDSLQQIARPLTGIMMYRIIHRAGQETAVAAFGIGGQMISYTFILLAGLMAALAILVGQRLGEGRPEEVDHLMKFAYKVAYVNLAIFAIPYLILAKPILMAFTADPLVIAEGLLYLRIVYVGLLFVAVPTVLGGALKGAGYTYGPMVASLTANVPVKVGLAYLLAIRLGWGSSGVWWAVSVSVLVESLVLFTMARRKDWKAIVL